MNKAFDHLWPSPYLVQVMELLQPMKPTKLSLPSRSHMGNIGAWDSGNGKGKSHGKHWSMGLGTRKRGHLLASPRSHIGAWETFCVGLKKVTFVFHLKGITKCVGICLYIWCNQNQKKYPSILFSYSLILSFILLQVTLQILTYMSSKKLGNATSSETIFDKEW